MTKTCSRCNTAKELTEFSLSSNNIGGLNGTCKPCVCERNKAYWKTPKGLISKIVATQTACSKQRGHPLPKYARESLYAWAIANNLNALVALWAASGYQKDLSPSVDRLNPNDHYRFGNIRLVTWKDNNEKAYEDRKACIHVTRQNKRVEQLTLDRVHVAYYESIASAARATGGIRSNINAMCKEHPVIKSVKGFLWQYG